MTKKSGAGMKMGKAAQDALAKGADKVREQLSCRAEDAREQARRSALKTAQGMMQLQQKTFDGTIKLIAQLQDQTEKAVKDAVTGSQWLPKEGKAVVDEWIKTIHSGRVRFQQTVDKSFDLVLDYLKRVQDTPGEEAATAAKPAAKKSAAKKKPVKKSAKAKTAPKKKAGK